MALLGQALARGMHANRVLEAAHEASRLMQGRFLASIHQAIATPPAALTPIPSNISVIVRQATATSPTKPPEEQRLSPLGET